MSRKTRVIVVDDSALVRSLLAEIINRQRDMECIGTANDPLIAREMIREMNPDVITLDVDTTNLAQHIFAVTEQTSEGTRSTAKMVHELSRSADALKTSVARFKVNA